MLHHKTDKSNADPAAESGENRFHSGPDELDNIRIQTDCGHCHDDQKFAQFFQRGGYTGRKMKDGCGNRCKNEKQYEHRKGTFQTERRSFGIFGFPAFVNGED